MNFSICGIYLKNVYVGRFPNFVYESYELGFSWQVYKSIKADVRKSIGLS